MVDDPKPIRITEVGPRDGLQNVATPISAAVKIALIDMLSTSGVAEIEVSSFVSPKWVPQLADAAEVFDGIQRAPDVVYSALVPNEIGLERALDAAVDKVSVFTAASDTFNRRNTNASIAESLKRLRPVIEGAREADLPVRGYISCVIACPYEGRIEPNAVSEVAKALIDLGVDEIDLGDTIGVAVPTDIKRLYDAVGSAVPPSETTLHLHDTRGTALACLLEACRIGVASFDASVGGLGGCPYAPGAAGNLATEDAVHCLSRMGYDTGIDITKLIDAGLIIEGELARPLPGRVFRAEAACRLHETAED